jgi:hypothetical protein
MPPVPKKVMIVESGEIFASARACANYINGDYSAVYRCLRGNRETHLGFTFVYIEERIADE